MKKLINILALQQICSLLPVKCKQLRKWCIALTPWVAIIIIGIIF